MAVMRSESDSMGKIDVPADRYWGGPRRSARSITLTSAKTACRQN